MSAQVDNGRRYIVKCEVNSCRKRKNRSRVSIGTLPVSAGWEVSQRFSLFLPLSLSFSLALNFLLSRTYTDICSLPVSHHYISHVLTLSAPKKRGQKPKSTPFLPTTTNPQLVSTHKYRNTEPYSQQSVCLISLPKCY